MWYRFVLCSFILYRIELNWITFYRSIPHRTIPYNTIQYHVTWYGIASNRIVLCHTTSYRVIVPHSIASDRIVLYHHLFASYQVLLPPTSCLCYPPLSVPAALDIFCICHFHVFSPCFCINLHFYNTSIFLFLFLMQCWFHVSGFVFVCAAGPLLTQTLAPSEQHLYKYNQNINRSSGPFVLLGSTNGFWPVCRGPLEVTMSHFNQEKMFNLWFLIWLLMETLRRSAEVSSRSSHSASSGML